MKPATIPRQRLGAASMASGLALVYSPPMKIPSTSRSTIRSAIEA